jgi:hypothetical protein
MKYLKSQRKIILSVIFLNFCLLTVVEASQSFYGRCLLEVNKKKYLNGSCAITMENDGGFLIGASETQPVTYFAIISVTGKDVSEGFWNEEKGANHAHTPLGNLVRKGACWQNQKAKVCAWK